MNVLFKCPKIRNFCANVKCNKPGKNKCIVCNIRYCSKECQKADWSVHKKKCRKPSIPLPELDLCYRDLTIEEELFRAVDAFTAEENFYWAIDKNRKRDRVNFLQDLMKECMRTNGSNFMILDDNLKAELKRQYNESLSVESNDSPARLGHKIIIHSVISDLFNQMNIVMFSAVEEKKRLILITDAMQTKLQRLMDLTEANRLKHYPSKPNLPTACIDILRRKFEKNGEPEDPTKNSSKVPKNRAPFYKGPPAWMFPEGLAGVKELYKNTYCFMFRNIHVQRSMDRKHRFYCFNYPKENYCIQAPEREVALSYLEHCRLHRIGGASVTATPEAEAVILQYDLKMTLKVCV